MKFVFNFALKVFFSFKINRDLKEIGVFAVLGGILGLIVGYSFFGFVLWPLVLSTIAGVYSAWLFDRFLELPIILTRLRKRARMPGFLGRILRKVYKPKLRLRKRDAVTEKRNVKHLEEDTSGHRTHWMLGDDTEELMHHRD